MAGHKGYGLALLIETLSGGPDRRGDHAAGRPLDGRRPLRADRPRRGVHRRRHRRDDADRRVQAARRRAGRRDPQSPRAEGSDRIYLPGEIEWERRDRALAEGIVLPEDVRISVESLELQE